MSRYQERLCKHLDSHPHFILPLSRCNEVKGFLREPLKDLCISRPKKRVYWGVELPFDSNYVTYVWIDALLNYVSGIGYLQEEEKFNKWWNQAQSIHLIGKDILMTHSVYWPCLLMALDISLPQHILTHGWLLNKSEEKMSKSQGEVLDPLELANELGVSELRYFLTRALPFGQDAFISKKIILQRIHQDLSNQLGNILSRVSRLVEKHFESKIPFAPKEDQESKKMRVLSESTQQKVQDCIKQFQLNQALEQVFLLLGEVNRYLERMAPWKLIRSDKISAQRTLCTSLEVLRYCGILLYPVMPEKMNLLLKILNSENSFKSLKWGLLSSGSVLSQTQPLFPKIQTTKKTKL